MAGCSPSGARALLGAVLACLVMRPVTARAQAEDQAAARALFNEARELLKAERYAEACPKFEAARRLFESAGTILNLGDCYEHVGRTASAWTEFGEAFAVAQRTGRANEAAEAAKRQAALEPALSYLLIRVLHATPEMLVFRDGAELPNAAWGAAIPVDPGPHQVQAKAPGREPWSTSVTVSTSDRISVDVPELAPSSTVAPASNGIEATTPAPVAEPKSRSTTLGWVLVGGGAVLGLAGGALMIVESVRAADARESNDGAAWDSTKTPWMIGLAGVAAGGISVGVGFALLSSSHGDGAAAATAGQRIPGLRFSGVW